MGGTNTSWRPSMGGGPSFSAPPINVGGGGGFGAPKFQSAHPLISPSPGAFNNFGRNLTPLPKPGMGSLGTQIQNQLPGLGQQTAQGSRTFLPQQQNFNPTPLQPRPPQPQSNMMPQAMSIRPKPVVSNRQLNRVQPSEMRPPVVEPPAKDILPAEELAKTSESIIRNSPKDIQPQLNNPGLQQSQVPSNPMFPDNLDNVGTQGPSSVVKPQVPKPDSKVPMPPMIPGPLTDPGTSGPSSIPGIGSVDSVGRASNRAFSDPLGGITSPSPVSGAGIGSSARAGVPPLRGMNNSPFTPSSVRSPASMNRFTPPSPRGGTLSDLAAGISPGRNIRAMNDISDISPDVSPPSSITSPLVPQGSDPLSLGNISGKYESNGKWDTISTGRGDPGGVSYGKYQLASRTGTLNSFLNKSGYKQEFAGMRPGTSSFNNKWRELSGNKDFQAAQHNFIKQTHFTPVRSVADRLGLPNDPAVNEALWSMGVQHGGAKSIVNNAFKGENVSAMSPEQIVNRLYDARANYVTRLRKVPFRTKQSILNRYRRERQDVLGLIQ